MRNLEIYLLNGHIMGFDAASRTNERIGVYLP